MKLYELTENYKNLEELLDNPDVPQEVLQNSLKEVKEEIEVKVENIAKLIKNRESDIEGIKKEEKRLKDKRQSMENGQLLLKKYLEEQLQIVGIKKVKTKLFTVAMQNNPPSVSVESEELIPECFYIIKKELSRTALLEAIKNGQEIEGVKLRQGESLRIR